MKAPFPFYSNSFNSHKRAGTFLGIVVLCAMFTSIFVYQRASAWAGADSLVSVPLSPFGVPCSPPSTVYVDDDWAAVPPGNDPDGAGPATNFGCASFATIQTGVAGVATGGVVIVNAGTYNGPQIFINRTMSVLGAGSGTTIIDGLGAAPPTGGLVHIETALGDTGNVTFSGFKITNWGTISGTTFAIFAKPLDPVTTATISNNSIVGVNSGDSGFWTYRNRGPVVFDHNQITNTGGNGVLIEEAQNSTDVHHNTITVSGISTSYFNMTYESIDVTSLQRVADNTINSPNASAIVFNSAPTFVSGSSRFGKYTNVQIATNVITQLATARNGISLLNDTTDTTGVLGAIENPSITGNIVTGTDGATSYGIRFRGLVTNAAISSNDVRHLARGFSGELAGAGHAATGTQAHVNNFVGNAIGFWSDGVAAVNAENNWWGCNFGPGVGGTGCSGTANGLGGTGVALIDANPWLVLGVSASPNPVAPAGTSTVTADMTDNSAAADTTGSGTVPLTPVAFSAGAGTMSPPTGTITAGLGTSVFTSTSALNGYACALVDNQTTCTVITKTGATAASSTIHGRIADDQGRPVSGTVVYLTGEQQRKTITDANGEYHFDDVTTADFYTVTPDRANFRFTPAQRSFSQIANRTEAVFTGSLTGDSANPLDTPEYFVRQQYVDILGREPEEGGFNYWSNQILACGNDSSCVNGRRRDVAASFFISEEFQASGSYLYDVYVGALGRRPAFNEYSNDRQQVVGGATLDAVKTAFAQSFVQRPEFITRYQNDMSAEAFVDALLRSVQASGANLGGVRETLIGEYLQGNQGADQVLGRAAVVKAMADNATFKQSQYNSAFVLTEYFGYLRRDPDQAGYEFWVNVVNTGDVNNYRGLVCAFVTSAEYQRRFSSIVSHSNGECGQ